jgi:hypothetical protein
MEATQTVNVSGELVAWLEAARFFKQLGMEQRMVVAYERAGALIPADPTFVGHSVSTAYAARIEGDEERPKRARRKTTSILAHSLGG